MRMRLCQSRPTACPASHLLSQSYVEHAEVLATESLVRRLCPGDVVIFSLSLKLLAPCRRHRRRRYRHGMLHTSDWKVSLLQEIARRRLYRLDKCAF